MSDEELRNRLLEQDGAVSPGLSERERKDIRDMLTIARQRADRMRRMTIITWLAVIGLFVLGGIVEAVFRPAPPPMGSPGMSAQYIWPIGIALRVAFVVAVVSTLSYVIRSRGASIAEMNHRLARLEELVESMARQKKD